MLLRRMVYATYLLPVSARAEFRTLEVHYDPPPTEAEIFLGNPGNWVQLGILAVLVGIGVVLLRRKSSPPEN